MTTYTEPFRPFEFLVSEANGHRSRDQVNLTAAQGDLLPGTVLAKVTATGNYVPYDDDNNGAVPGSGVAAGVLCYAAPNNAAIQLVTIIARDAEIDSNLLQWEASNDSTEKGLGLADMLLLGIVTRS